MGTGKIVRVLVVALVFVMAFGLMVSPAAAQPPEMVKVLIGFDRQPSPDEEAIVHRAGGSIKYTYHLVPAIAASVPEAAIAGLERNPKVEYIEDDGKAYPDQEVLPWGVDRIDAELVHPYNTGADVKVFILDTGIDYSHPDLDDNYHGGVGYRDGTMIDPLDDHGHGTHVAGIAAAEDNEIGVIGVAPGAWLYGIKVLNQFEDGYYGLYSDIIAGIEWSVINEAQVINMSFGGTGDSESLHAACDAAYDSGVLLVSSAGNSGNPPGRGDNIIYPAKYSSVIAVAATNQDDERARWSSTGPDLELSAPGVDINSTLLGGGYGEKDGTSMASPHVAGVAALVIAGEGLSNVEVRTRLQVTADDLGPDGFDTKYGYGLVDAGEAAAGPPEPAVNVALSTDKAEYIGGTDTTAVLTVVVTDETGSAISGLVSTDFTTTVNGVGADVTFAETETAGTYRGNLDISGLPEGTHRLEVTVTDTRGISGSDTASFSIVSETTTKTILAHSTEFRIEAKGKSGNVKLLLDVHVVEGDVGGPPVAGATVSVEITAPDGTLYAGSGDTNGNGDVTFQVAGNPQSGTWTAEVTNIEELGYQFDPTRGDTTAEITL